MKTLLLLLMCCHVSSAVIHSLEFFITATHGIPDFPEFVALGMLDGVPIGHCDGKDEPDPDRGWIKKLLKNNPGHLKWYNHQCYDNLYFCRENIDMIMQSLNQTGGVHILQKRAGCEWDAETEETVGFIQFGYDGEDFLSLDLQTLTWTAQTPEALMTKYRWDTDKARLQENKVLCTQECPRWIKQYLQYRRFFQQRTGKTSVSLLQKSPSSPVSCFATGFSPDRAAMFWRKDGEELREDVDHGEILPNHDNTFQMSVNLTISSVKPEDWGRYECVFQLHGVEEDIITKLDKAEIISNYESSIAAVTGVVVVVLVLLCVCILGFFFLKRRHTGFQPANRGQELTEEKDEVH